MKRLITKIKTKLRHAKYRDLNDRINARQNRFLLDAYNKYTYCGDDSMESRVPKQQRVTVNPHPYNRYKLMYGYSDSFGLVR